LNRKDSPLPNQRAFKRLQSNEKNEAIDSIFVALKSERLYTRELKALVALQAKEIDFFINAQQTQSKLLESRTLKALREGKLELSG